MSAKPPLRERWADWGPLRQAAWLSCVAIDIALISAVAYGMISYAGQGEQEARNSERAAQESADLEAQLRAAALEALLEEHECSRTGLGAEIPAGALVARPDGSVELVSFDAGWRAQTSTDGTKLIAVCRNST